MKSFYNQARGQAGAAFIEKMILLSIVVSVIVAINFMVKGDGVPDGKNDGIASVYCGAATQLEGAYAYSTFYWTNPATKEHCCTIKITGMWGASTKCIS
ncbi:MAG: hypothetical protein J5J00_14365 [Deltaproteobacteria bacterium]|nr:hypothetical protein [Deltaproteobacteria bacterium]